MLLYKYYFNSINDEAPRINYDNFFDSIIAIILIFYNEEWHFSMYKYAQVNEYRSITFYLFMAMISQILILNLFEAIFLNKFMVNIVEHFFETKKRIKSKFKNLMKLSLFGVSKKINSKIKSFKNFLAKKVKK